MEAEPVESDDDRTFVETLIFGGRLIGRELNEPREGLKFLRRALELMDAEGAVTKNDDELRSRIEGTKGLLKMALVIKGTRSTLTIVHAASSVAHNLICVWLLPRSRPTSALGPAVGGAQAPDDGDGTVSDLGQDVLQPRVRPGRVS